MSDTPDHPDDFDPSSETMLDPNTDTDTDMSLVEVGGPEAFYRALVCKLDSLVWSGCHCVILEPTLHPDRYVQVLLSPVGVRVESVGQLYLGGTDNELTQAQTSALQQLGWLEPPTPDEDPDWSWPHNWWVEFSGPGFIDRAAGLLLATLIEVHDLLDIEPVQLRIFDATNQDYRWETDPAHPCGGWLEAV